jgi:hypothetical protein
MQKPSMSAVEVSGENHERGQPAARAAAVGIAADGSLGERARQSCGVRDGAQLFGDLNDAVAGDPGVGLAGLSA